MQCTNHIISTIKCNNHFNPAIFFRVVNGDGPIQSVLSPQAPIDGGDGDGVLRHQQVVESILGFSIPILSSHEPRSFFCGSKRFYGFSGGLVIIPGETQHIGGNHIYTYVCIYIYIYLYICISIYIYMRIHSIYPIICMCIYIYIYISSIAMRFFPLEPKF